MNDLTLALMGLSAGVGSMVGAWVALWYRDRVPIGHKQLIHRLYVHADELLGATKTENQVRAGKRFAAMRPWWRGGLGKNLGRAWADVWWPVPQFGGTSARPTTKRMAAYVKLEMGRPRAWFKPFRIWDIVAVTVFWTSEANPMAGNIGENVGRKVAQALRLEGVGQLAWDIDWDRGCIRYERKGPAPEFQPTVPHGVAADA